MVSSSPFRAFDCPCIGNPKRRPDPAAVVGRREDQTGPEDTDEADAVPQDSRRRRSTNRRAPVRSATAMRSSTTWLVATFSRQSGGTNRM